VTAYSALKILALLNVDRQLLPKENFKMKIRLVKTLLMLVILSPMIYSLSFAQEELAKVIIEEDGLNPEDYHLSQLLVKKLRLDGNKSPDPFYYEKTKSCLF
jgi:hypothetical protein